jgi:hypothetical protein
MVHAYSVWCGTTITGVVHYGASAILDAVLQLWSWYPTSATGLEELHQLLPGTRTECKKMAFIREHSGAAISIVVAKWVFVL